MSNKTATVTVRMEPEIKEKAEKIMEELGLPVSVVISMFYRQIIAKNGIPFALTIPGIPDEDTMSETELDAILERGYQQSLNGETTSAEEIFARLMELE
ncbi:MAG: type II toxin-antitoxin system RelB/DinJ family antitoxin [Clostridia bacterium]|nr:type II toxin-antitoxin system RelB/DinJ family antitoxin [Clostridia bacterium]